MQMRLEVLRPTKVVRLKASTLTLFRELPARQAEQLQQGLVLVLQTPWQSSHVTMLWILLRAKHSTLRVALIITRILRPVVLP
jgi:hypothetical protein